MGIITVGEVGKIGVIKDLSKHELPINAWTQAQNIRFLDGYAYQAFGEAEVYQTPPNVPQHVFPIAIGGTPYWIVITAANAYAVTSASGVATYTDLTHATPLTGTVNQWTSTLLSGIPVINAGNETNIPAAWDLNLANNFVDLTNWPAATYCKSLRAFKNFLVALNITKASTNYPFMVKWSHPAQPGALPSSWDHTDATKDAGEVDLAEGYDSIIDGLQLRDSFIIYKQDTTWSMSYIGGVSIFGFRKIFGHGMLSRNCAVEYDGLHFVVTRSDVILHDGNTAVSVLDKQTRRFLFEDIDPDGVTKVFVVKHPYMNEIYVCYPSLGAATCNKALVWNYKDKTVSFRDMPDINHANFGFINNNLSGQWDQDADTWDSDLTSWQQGDYIPVAASVILASSDGKLYQLDGAATSGGQIPDAMLERVGLSFGDPSKIKLIKSVRPIIVGSTGETVKISVGYSADAFADPTYTEMTHTIGETVSNDCLVAGRYNAIKFESGTATQWRLDSYQIEVEEMGDW